MKLTFFKTACLAFIVLIAAACGNDGKMTVTVSNNSQFDREGETVEIPWERIAGKLSTIAAADIVVTGKNGEQIPSQVIFNGEPSPKSVIFQVDLPAGEKAKYKIFSGVREDYKPMVFGRFVPERLDDYAWENNLAAFRIYGPALERELVTNGIDYWSKTTPELIINKWYAEGHYHDDKGEGNDCYKVGVTLGAGASAPFIGDTLRFSRNFAAWETLDNGPIRTTVRLTYAPFDAGGKTVSFTKTISLDANSRFNKITDVFTGDFDTIPVAAGVVIHDGARLMSGMNYIAVGEPASDSKTGLDGDTFVAVIMDGLKKNHFGGNYLAVGKAVKDEPFVYHMGAGTSKADVVMDDVWIEMIRRATERLKEPLVVK